jgi:hypothetical protein
MLTVHFPKRANVICQPLSASAMQSAECFRQAQSSKFRSFVTVTNHTEVDNIFDSV